MSLNEADTRAKLIDPVLYVRGWTEDLIRREQTPGRIEIVDGKPRRGRGRVDYLLRVRVNSAAAPVPVALLEAKAEDRSPFDGLEQAKRNMILHHVPFCFSCNGHQFIEYDSTTGQTRGPILMSEFPTPQELRQRWEVATGIHLDAPEARPFLIPYPGGDTKRRYYQDAAIRAALEKIAKGGKRVLLYLATGSGKTFIAVHLLKKIAEAGQLRRALFVCDRDELRTQAHSAFYNVFGADAAEVTTSNPQKNARILIATYQTLNVAGEEEDARFFLYHYPENYFSHIIIDECHRSAWGKWSIILRRNPEAVHIGLTATPRVIEGGTEEERREDEEITWNNLQYFGEPVYCYEMAQGIEDGYLAACEIVRRDISIDLTGVTREDIERLGARDPATGRLLVTAEAKERYEATEYERLLVLPDRVRAVCQDIFKMLLQTGGPLQKTIIFCVNDEHADRVAVEMNNLYAQWARENGQELVEFYAFKCTAKASGNDQLPDFRGSRRSHFVATTVDLISTGVDVPCVQNIVFFRYVHSPIAFHQMMGRGTRVDPTWNKYMFRVYDYTNATRLLGHRFVSRDRPTCPSDEEREERREQRLLVEGFDVRVNPAGTYIVLAEGDRPVMVTLEEYRQRLAERLIQEAPTPEDLRDRWVDPQKRRDLVDALPEDGRGLALLKCLLGREQCDDYDVLMEIGYGLPPKSRQERAEALTYKHRGWLDGMPDEARRVVIALVDQFVRGGTTALENPQVFRLPEVARAGGVKALQALGNPREIIEEMKRRLFTL